MPKVTFKCLNCGTEKERYINKTAVTPKFCGRFCFLQYCADHPFYRSKIEIKKCNYCGEKFLPVYPNTGRRMNASLYAERDYCFKSECASAAKNDEVRAARVGSGSFYMNQLKMKGIKLKPWHRAARRVAIENNEVV